jgi:hypothetical protein
MHTATEKSRKYDKMVEALADYASENGRLNAEDYCDAGYELAECAAGISDALDRGEFIEANLSTFPESACYLIACAASYRLAELTRDHDPDAYTFKVDYAEGAGA